MSKGSHVVFPNFRIRSREVKSHKRSVMFATHQTGFDAIKNAIDGETHRTHEDVCRRALEQYLALPAQSLDPKN